MARSPKLKVFRTPIGFHDAYVAAPSQKAAIEAWGAAKDLFQRGEAELVTDAALTAEPLAHPGVVVKRLRGTAAEQIAALPPDKPRRARQSPPQTPEPRPTPANPAKAPPRPSRAALDGAERTLRDTEERHDAARKALAEREAALVRERRALEKAQAAEHDKLVHARDAARERFDRDMRVWRG